MCFVISLYINLHCESTPLPLETLEQNRSPPFNSRVKISYIIIYDIYNIVTII